MWSLLSLLSLSFLESAHEYALLTMKLTLTRLWVGLPAMTTCLRMCPPLTTKNWLYYAPVVAIGMANGSILIYNLHSRHIVKELAIHSFPVRWVWLRPCGCGHLMWQVGVGGISGDNHVRFTFLLRIPSSYYIYVVPASRLFAGV